VIEPASDGSGLIREFARHGDQVFWILSARLVGAELKADGDAQRAEAVA